MARDAPVIEAFGAGGFRLDGVRHEGSVLILQDVAQAWPVAALADLTLADFDLVLSAGPTEVEFVLLGTGARNALPPRSVREGLQAAGLGCEFMDTPAAARLYNLLTADGRRLAAALIAV